VARDPGAALDALRPVTSAASRRTVPSRWTGRGGHDLWPASLPARLLIDDVGGDAQQPRRHGRAALLVASIGLERLQECLRRDILGAHVIARAPVGEGEYGGVVALV